MVMGEGKSLTENGVVCRFFAPDTAESLGARPESRNGLAGIRGLGRAVWMLDNKNILSGVMPMDDICDGSPLESLIVMDCGAGFSLAV